jgi:O-antigen ligase
VEFVRQTPTGLASLPAGVRLGRRALGAALGLPLAVAASAAVLGFAAALEPVLAVAAVVALALVPVVLAVPIVGIVLLVFMSFLEEYAGMTGTLSVTKLLGALLVAGWFAAVATGSHGAEGKALLRREPFLVAALVAFTAWAAMSLVWAQAPADTQTSVQRYALNFMLFPVALLAIRAPRHVLWIVTAFAAGAFAAVLLGLQAGTLDGEGRLAGAGINPNQLGSYLVVTIVFLATFGVGRVWSGPARAAALTGAVLAALAVFLTLSRGALVGLAVALLVAPIVAGAGRRAGVLVLTLAAILGTLAWFGAVAPPDHVERVTNPDRDGGAGRTDLWRVGWRMVEDRPVQGVGAGNYPVASIDYLLRPGATENDSQIVDEQKVAHNIYLTVLSELGIVGMALFAVIVGLCLRSALRAARAFGARGDPAMELASRALFISIVSLLAVGFFSSALYVKQFWILLAAAPALHALAERDRRSTSERPGAPAPFERAPAAG